MNCRTGIGTALCLLLIPALTPAQDATARVMNKALAYPRGERCVVVLAVAGADEVAFNVSGLLAQTVPVADGEARYEIDTTLLRAADYEVRARLLRQGEMVGRAMLPLSVGPQPDAERMPVWKWGYIAYELEELLFWQRLGFTGGPIGSANRPAPRFASRTTHMEILDEGVKRNMELGFYMDPLSEPSLAERDELRGTFASGARPETIQPLAPETIEYCRGVADTWTQELAGFPALRFLFVNSEYETSMAPHPVTIQDAQEQAGIDITTLPIEEGSHYRGRLAVNPAEFADGVIDDDHPHYRCLKWFWERGHGTAAVNEAMSDAAKRHRPDLVTYHDPYRLAPVRHTHQGLDMISTWTYGTPDIKRLIYTTYLQGAARARQQRVLPTITMLLYAYMVMPLDNATADFSRDYGGSDPFFLTGPDYTREASWIVVSQRPDALSYYIQTSNDFSNPRIDPVFSSPSSAGAIAEVTQRLIQPYGPAILDAQRLRPRVALLASATGDWFHTGSFNSGYPAEQTLPYASLLWMNHVPFDVLLDDDLIEGAAADYDALVLPFSATVTKRMAERLREFAAAGGKVIVNEPFRLDLPGAIRTAYDFYFEFSVRGTAGDSLVTAEEHRRRMEAYAADLAPHLEGLHGPVRPAGIRVLANSLDAGDVQYHFLINDDRTYGPQFGAHQVWFELGVPQRERVAVTDERRPVLYDAMRRLRLETAAGEAGTAQFEIALPAADGRLIAALPESIDAVRIAAPETARAGAPVTLTLSVLGESGSAISGSLPLRVEIDDAFGRRVEEWSRFTTTRRAQDGVCRYTFIPAINDAAGEWTIHVTDLVGGKTAAVNVTVLEDAGDERTVPNG